MEYKFSKNYSELYRRASQSREAGLQKVKDAYNADLLKLKEKYKQLRESAMKRATKARQFEQQNNLISQAELAEKQRLEDSLAYAIRLIEEQFERTKRDLMEGFSLEQRASNIKDRDFERWLANFEARHSKLPDKEIERELDQREAEWRRQNPNAE
jgi:hypothetical protein